MRQDFAKLYRSGYSGMPAEKLLSFLKLPLDKCSLTKKRIWTYLRTQSRLISPIEWTPHMAMVSASSALILLVSTFTPSAPPP